MPLFSPIETNCFCPTESILECVFDFKVKYLLCYDCINRICQKQAISALPAESVIYRFLEVVGSWMVGPLAL